MMTKERKTLLPVWYIVFVSVVGVLIIVPPVLGMFGVIPWDFSTAPGNCQ